MHIIYVAYKPKHMLYLTVTAESPAINFKCVRNFVLKRWILWYSLCKYVSSTHWGLPNYRFYCRASVDMYSFFLSLHWRVWRMALIADIAARDSRLPKWGWIRKCGPLLHFLSDRRCSNNVFSSRNRVPYLIRTGNKTLGICTYDLIRNKNSLMICIRFLAPIHIRIEFNP